MFIILSILLICIEIVVFFFIYKCKCLEPRKKEVFVIQHTEDNEYIFNLDIKNEI